MEKYAHDIAQQAGYSIEKRLNEYDQRCRFFVFRLINEGGEEAVLKVASASLHRELQNEVWWNMTLLRLQEAYPTLKLVPPSVYFVGHDWYISEFFDAPQIAPHGSTNPDKIDLRIGDLAQALFDLDSIAIQPKLSQKPLYEPSNSAPYTNLLAKVDRWLEAPRSQGLLSDEEIGSAKQLIEAKKAFVKPALQHGDFVPWHMFDLSDGQIGIIDGEHCSLVKPRYYDLAYLYTRLFTRLQSAELPQRLLRHFLELSDIEPNQFTDAWLPVVTLRTFGMFADALADLEYQDYRDQAKDLLQRCLSQDLTAFTGV